MSFVHNLNSLCIELACQRLSQDELTVIDICYAVGFNNVSNFNRQCRAVKGIPPSKFRDLRHQCCALRQAEGLIGGSPKHPGTRRVLRARPG
jgi:AraC-like DNA-binding protein